MQGFFNLAPPEKSARSTPALKPQCETCGLYKTCKTPKMPVSGQGQKGILIVAEAPGKDEDEQGVSLVGQSGGMLRRALTECGISLDRDCWKTNAIICRPSGQPRAPTADEIDYCRPNLNQTIKELQPHVIITLGHPAIKSLVGPIFREDVGQVLRWVGRKIPDTTLNTWICPTWHPQALLYAKDKQDGPTLAMLWRRHLAAAVALEARPYETPPDYKKGIETYLDADEGAAALAGIPRESGILSFDYETDRLKPDRTDARIVCASVAWGSRPGQPKRTVVVPWHGAAIHEFKKLMAAPVLKISHNLQMEDRWTRRFFGHPPRNWRWCTMQTAHVLDNRQSVVGLKFQAYVKFGQPGYDDHIKPFLESTGTATISETNSPNRIRELPLDKLMEYCGLDSVLSYMLAWDQAAELGCQLLI